MDSGLALRAPWNDEPRDDAFDRRDWRPASPRRNGCEHL